MKTKKDKFVDYLNENASRYSSDFVHPGIKAGLSGDFSKLPEYLSVDDWRVLALMVDGYALSEQLGLGDLGDFLTKHCLPKYLETGTLPEITIELWIFLYGLQRREKWNECPLEGKERNAALKVYLQLRQNLQSAKGVEEMIKSLETNDYERYRKGLIHRYWQYQEAKFHPAEKYFDRPNNNYQRPPVFIQSEARRNILTESDTETIVNEQLYGLIARGEHHKWFRSMNSSQALAVSVLGNLFVHGGLYILSELKDDNGLPLLGKSNIGFDNFSMEHKINYLGEPRRTSIDAFISGVYQIVLECKFTEFEVGSCSRPRLTKRASNYEQQYCNGAYIRQRSRKERCALTEIGVKYWEYIPYFFHWERGRDYDACPLRYNYQLVRNILAAGIKEDGSLSPTNGHVIMVYDRRNPACQHGGKIFKSYHEIKEALIYPRMLRKIYWQNILGNMREENVLPWLTKNLYIKYGF